MTQDHTIQILWDAIEKRDRAVIEEDANIRKSYDMGNTNVDAYRFKRNWLEKELSALHEVTTAILGYPSRMTVVDAYYGLPWDHDEFRYRGRVVTGIEESRDPGYFILYLEVSDECKVTGNTWLNRKPIPPREPGNDTIDKSKHLLPAHNWLNTQMSQPEPEMPPAPANPFNSGDRVIDQDGYTGTIMHGHINYKVQTDNGGALWYQGIELNHYYDNPKPAPAEAHPELDLFYAGLRAAQGTALDPRKMGVPQDVIDQANAATPPAPAVKLTRRQRIILEGLTRHKQLYYPNLTNTLKIAADRLSGRKLIMRNGNYLTITEAGKAALEGVEA